MKNKVCYLVLLSVLALACRNSNKDNDHGPHDEMTRDEKAIHNIEGLNDTDRDFISKAIYANRAEAELGELADKKGASDSVQEYGELMKMDHSKALDDLKDLASSKGVETPEGLDAEHTALKTKLEGMRGHNFDTAYMNSMIAGHKKVISLFEETREKGTDRQVKEYIDTYLPHIKMHLEKAERIAGGLK